jgi:hypothetical protein
MLDTFLDWSVVFLPTVVSVVGVWISVRPPESSQQLQWRWALIGFGILVSILTFWQQNRTRESQLRTQTRLQETLDKTRLELQDSRTDAGKDRAFLSGQLTILAQLTANPPRNPDFSNMAEALKLIADKPSEREQTNLELLREAQDLGRRLREFQQRIDSEKNRRNTAFIATAQADGQARQRYIQEEMALYSRQRAEFEPLRAEALALRHKIVPRLADPPKEDSFVNMTLAYGGLAGVAPASQVGTYLETLARLLPQAPGARPK